MKRIITSVLITLNFCILYAATYYPQDNVFRVIDETGYEIIYNIDEDDNGEYATILAAYGTADTLIVPDSVEYKGVTYAVCGWMPMSGSVNLEGQESIELQAFIPIEASVICLPKTLKYCWHKREDNPPILFHSAMSTQKFCVAEDNPYFVSPDGVIYTADMQTLIAFPMGRRGRYDMPEGVKRLESFSCCIISIDTLNLAESVEELGNLALYGVENLKSFRYTDNIRTLKHNLLIYGSKLEEVILGSGLKDLGTTASISSSEYSAFRALYCLAPEPPELQAKNIGSGLELLTLFVPRASINLYEAHPAWGLFPRITSIEPPIVSGINEAEVTWVSNADATGYSWELYRDEERTVLVMRLTFNRIGQLSRLEFGSGFMTSSSPAPMHAAAEDADGDGEHSEETTERQFTTYFSFTVENLSPNTQYYYTRKTYGETGEDGEPVVIDEEQSDFTTLSDTPTSLSSAADAPAVQKVFRNGNVYILNGDETYTLTGAEVK